MSWPHQRQFIQECGVQELPGGFDTPDLREAKTLLDELS